MQIRINTRSVLSLHRERSVETSSLRVNRPLWMFSSSPRDQPTTIKQISQVPLHCCYIRMRGMGAILGSPKRQHHLDKLSVQRQCVGARSAHAGKRSAQSSCVTYPCFIYNDTGHKTNNGYSLITKKCT